MQVRRLLRKYTYFITKLKTRLRDLAYLHAVEAHVDQSGVDQEVPEDKTLDFVRNAWAPKTLIVAGGYVRETRGIKAATKGNFCSVRKVVPC